MTDKLILLELHEFLDDDRNLSTFLTRPWVFQNKLLFDSGLLRVRGLRTSSGLTAAFDAVLFFGITLNGYVYVYREQPQETPRPFSNPESLTFNRLPQ